MWTLYTGGGLLAVLAVLFGVCALRAVGVKAKQPARLEKNLELDAARAESYAQTLSKMIQCETVSSLPAGPLDKFYHFHDEIEKLFPQLHETAEKHVFDGSLLFHWRGGNELPILLMSHHDVVEAAGGWLHPPFSGEIAEGRIWGRGTLDTKNTLFGILQAVEELIAAGYTPRGDVYIASSCNEETNGSGAKATAAYLQEQGVRLALLIDEGGAITEQPMPGIEGCFAMVGVLEKGYGDLKFTARGVGGHSSIQQRGTPLVRLAQFIAGVERRDPFRPVLNGTVVEMFRRMAPYMPFWRRLVFSNLWLFRPVLERMMGRISPTAGAMIKTTIAFTTAKGSDGYNVIPNEAFVTGNLRFSPHQDLEESVDIMRRRAARYGLETEIIQADPACKAVPHDSPAFRRVADVVSEVFPGVVVTPYAMTGATDARYYECVCENLLRFSPILCDPAQHATIHSYNENCLVLALPGAVDFYKNLITRVENPSH